ncbi:homoserine kinase [Bacillus tianshenii]|uniref:homoserine kinase n=1 Tax=Sutcliffiella tianshenii TaxID=1463404 RepID=UPI001CD27CD8|nr:homoserine kinase [Bacillus tianshenii]MCA1319757.1 homoserine kinase [Bacillus tianshenii]
MKEYKNGYVIKVPGSSANLGPGFDSIGLAVTKYVTLFVQYAKEWRFTSVPPLFLNEEDNLLQTVCLELETLWEQKAPPVHVHIMSDIPLARGLGSSAAAIVGAIEVMNIICGKNLTPDEKLQLAARFEGHADNVAASLYGGLVVSTFQNGCYEYIKLPVPNMELVVVVPNFEAKTSESRQLLPEVLPFKDAVLGSSHANVLIGGLLMQDWKLAGKMMESDVFHEPYRLKLFPQLSHIRDKAKGAGAFGVSISGAGPTIICFCKRGEGRNVKEKLQEDYPEFTVDHLEISAVGSEVHSNHFSCV